MGVLINIGTTTSLVSSVNPSSFGQSVTFTATVTGHGNRIPTGTVSFMDGTTDLENAGLNSSGVAKFSTSALAVGTHSMTAVYSGDAHFGSSTSPVLYQVVQGAIVSLSPTSLNFGNQTVGITSTPQHVMLTNQWQHQSDYFVDPNYRDEQRRLCSDKQLPFIASHQTIFARSESPSCPRVPGLGTPP